MLCLLLFRGGGGSVVADIPQRGGRRRRILPDGRRVYATDFETAKLLQQLRKQKSIEARNEAKQIEQVVKQEAKPEIIFEDPRILEEEFILFIHESTRRDH